MPDQGGIQLLPETRRKINVKTPGMNRWLYAGVFALILVFLAIIGLVLYHRGLESKIVDLDNNLTNLEKERDKKAETNLLILSKQLSLATTILNNHIFWSKALEKIGALTQPQVQFITFTSSAEDGEFEIKALTLNYTTLARQIASYVSDDAIKDINLSDVHVLTNGKLEFMIKIAFDKNKFLKE